MESRNIIDLEGNKVLGGGETSKLISGDFQPYYPWGKSWMEFDAYFFRWVELKLPPTRKV